MTDYTRSGPFTNGQLPAVNDDALNNMDVGIDNAHSEIEALAALVAQKIGLPASPSTGDVLTYDGAAWVAEPVEVPSGIPTGTILDYDGDTAPTGYLMLTEDVQLVSRATYADLFGIVGTKHSAGDGSTTFGLPPAGGKTLVGRDAGDSDFGTLGAVVGAKTHTLTEAELPVHDHPTTETPHTHGWYAEGGGTPITSRPGGAVGNGNVTTMTTLGASTGLTVGNAGSDQAHNNIQPSLVTNKIIKT